MSDEYPPDAVLMCMRTADSTTVFADSKHCPCADCGQEVHYRPYVPDHVTKVCIQCVARRMTASGEHTFRATKRSLDEARLFFAKAKGGKQ